MLFPQSVCLEEEDAEREASENHVTQHVNLSFPDLQTQNFQPLSLVYGLPTIDHIYNIYIYILHFIFYVTDIYALTSFGMNLQGK